MDVGHRDGAAVAVGVLGGPARPDRVVVGRERRERRGRLGRRRVTVGRRTRVRRRQFLRRLFRTAVLRPSPERQAP